MNKFLTLTSILFISATLNLNANDMIHQFARDNQRGLTLFKNLEDRFYNEVDNISKQNTLSTIDKQARIRMLRNTFMENSRQIHLKYRQPFLDAVIKETNDALPKGRGVQKTLGSDIYVRDKSGKIATNKNGTAKLNKKHRGMSGDIDLGGDPQSINQLKNTLRKYGVKPTTKGVYNHLDFDSIELTINNGGVHVHTVNNSLKPEMSLHESQMLKASINPDGTISSKKNIELNAFSKETYNYVAMSDNQAGSSYVLTLDNNKKAIEGFRSSSSDLLKPKSEVAFQGMNKGTLKSISSGKVSDDQILKIIAKNKLKMSVERFKNNLTAVKEGHIASGIGITDTVTMSKYQSICKDITKEAVNNASKIAQVELDTVNKKINELNDLINITPDGLEKESYIRQAKMWAEQNADSKLRIESGVKANNTKLNAPKPNSALASGVKGSLKALNVLGNIKDGYDIYTTYSQYKEGKITKDKAVTVLGTKSVEIGMNVASGVASSTATSAAATTTIGTISTVVAPIAITMVATHYVSEATKEGLEMMAAFKNEELLTNMANEQMKKVSQSFIQKANNHLTQGITTGDFNNFIAAEDIAWKLYEMYERTGDTALLDASQKISDRSESITSFLEEEHGVSIFALKSKLDKVAQQHQVKDIEKKKKVIFFSDNQDSLAKEKAFRNNMKQQREQKANADNARANRSLGNAMSQAARKSDAFKQGFVDFRNEMDKMGNEYLKQEAFRKKNYDLQQNGINTSQPKRSYKPVGTTNKSKVKEKFWAKITWTSENKTPRKDFDNPTKYGPLKITCTVSSFKPNVGAKNHQIISYRYQPSKKSYRTIRGYKQLVFGIYSHNRTTLNNLCRKNLSYTLQSNINNGMYHSRQGFTGDPSSLTFIKSASWF